ncbi:carbohydrate kinase family protein [Peterkaempfera bronchialis]|uniref:carbohydrate kinase family protein n=1 Tax=Peterkaempfera bronchialis TaxID=2126346 RepID=UPI003C2FDBB6
MTRPAVLVVGEALTDVVAGPDGQRRAHPGGSPANVALGLARLGHPVELATRIGRDRYGQVLRDHLTDAGVRLTPGSIVDAPTSTATAELDGQGSASYRFDISWDLPDLALPPCHHLHTGSIATALEPGATRVERLLAEARPGRTISYDPNLRPALLGPPAAERPRVERLVAAADLVKASEEDLAWLHPDADPDAVAARWARSGPALVVLTRGAGGACAYWGAAGRQPLPAQPVTVADTIGAGDAFMAGLLAGLLTADLLGGGGAALREAAGGGTLHPGVAAALRLAGRAAAVACSRAGADLPTLAEVGG